MNVPTTPEKLDSSNERVAVALLTLAKTFQNELEDYQQAIYTYEIYLQRFPDKLREGEIYLGLQYCYNKIGDAENAKRYRDLLEKQFADSRSAKILNDPASLDPEKNNPKASKQYEHIYDLFISGQFDSAFALKKVADSINGNKFWTPQLLYIEAMYYVKCEQDSDAIRTLQNLKKLYPKSPLAEKAATLIDVLGRRKQIEAYLSKLDVKRAEEDDKVLITDSKNVESKKPQVAALTNGGAVFVWQGGKQGFQKIYARFLPASGTNFLATDIRVNTYTNNFQVNPSVATLTDGSVVVVWSSYGQDGYLQGVYGQRLTATGTKIGAEFQINQYSLNNQRTPAVTALASGGFAVAWVSELQRGASTVDIYARVFDSTGAAMGNEFPVNTVLTNLCANPSLAASPDGGFAVAWSQREIISGNSSASQVTAAPVVVSLNGWDVYVRGFDAVGVPTTSAVRVNTMTYGDQYAPAISAFGKSYLVVWQSLGQDGSMEGVYGQFLSSVGDLAGVEFQVNTGNATRQIHPAIASDGVNRFLVTWSSYASSTDFDLFARSYDLIRVSIVAAGPGVRLSWNTKPGCTYQVQRSANYSTWVNEGVARVAAGYSDFVDIAASTSLTVYRVVRIH